MAITVKAIDTNKETAPSCKCESWLEHWKKNNQANPNWCFACKKGFTADRMVGGQVFKPHSQDDSTFIVPMCKTCNDNKEKKFRVRNEDLVSIDPKKCKNK